MLNKIIRKKYHPGLIIFKFIKLMKEKENSSNGKSNHPSGDEKKPDLHGIPIYPASEDVYNKGQIASEVNPDDITRLKEPAENEPAGENNEKDFDDDLSGSDLDIPGAELDDQQEEIGSEDEENNYYSLGGDNHNDLEEDRGE